MYPGLKLFSIIFLLCWLPYVNVYGQNKPVNCNETYFHRKLLRNATTYVTDAVTSSNGSIFDAGSVYSSRSLPYLLGSIIKHDEKGNISWARSYSTGVESYNAWTSFLSVVNSNDGNQVIAGTMAKTSSQQSPVIMKINPNGGAIWTKYFTQNYQYVNIGVLTDGSIIYCINSYYGVNNKDIIGKLDKNGNQLWCKTVNTSRILSSSVSHVTPQIITNGNEIYLSTNVPDMPNKNSSYIFRINPADGNILWETKISAPDYTFSINSIAAYNNKLYFWFEVQDYPFSYFFRHGRICLGPDGSVQQTISFNAMPSPNNARFTFSKNDPFLASVYYHVDNKMALAYIDENGKVSWKYNYYPNLSQLNINAITKDPSGGWFLHTNYAENNNSYSAYMLSRVNSHGLIPGCVLDSSLFLTPIPFSLPVSAGTYNFSDTTIQIQNISLNTQNFSFTTEDVCVSQMNCNSVKLTGSNKVCNFKDSTKFIAVRNAGCSSQVSWDFDPSFISYSSTTDTSITLVFKKNGNFKLQSVLNTVCPIADSMDITISSSPNQINFGPDTVICQGGNILLNAKQGFLSYLWQNGSTDSTFLVTQPGSYHVDAQDACGLHFKDTIVVKPGIPLSFDLGPDLTKCNNDSITLTAPPGFALYSWSPAYAVNANQGQSITIFPDEDIVYKATAVPSNGCPVTDSVRVHVNHSAVIALGNDRNLCESDTLVLDAGPGFSNYQWNNGQSTQQINVFKPGSYEIKAIAANGCSSYDTVRILNVVNNPVVQLGTDRALCEHSTLDAGPGFSKYMWMNGANTQIIPVNTPGNYWVQVTDKNGCSGMDSISITEIKPIPQKFLPQDTSLCGSEGILIQPLASYRAYLWSNGSIDNHILVKEEGTYWLQAKDAFDCIGKDSIIVGPDRCFKGIYLPNAFTPNNDGKNDVFRPLIFGSVKQYHFYIYNRWGELIFETKTTSQGWNGSYHGIDQRSDVFIWRCIYQLNNLPIKEQKGTVVLVR